MALVTLQEARDYCKLTTADDGRLTLVLNGVSTQIEKVLGYAFGEVTGHSEEVNGGGESLLVTLLPVTDIDSITDNVTDTVIDESAYRLSESSGIIQKKSGRWSEGVNRYTVVYDGGVTAPDDIKLACLIWIANLMAVGNGMQSESMGDYSYTKSVTYQEMPAEVQKIIRPYKRLWF